MKKKKILITIPTIQYGGQEKVAVNTARLLSNDYDVTLLVFFRCDKEIDAAGLRVVSCDEKSYKGFKLIRRIWTMRQMKRQNGYYASISFSPSANLVNVITKDNAKTITSIRGYRSIFSKSGRLKWLMRKSDRVICVSEGIAAKVQQYYKMEKEKVEVLYNSYDFEKIKQLGYESVDDYSFQGRTICNVSHVNEVKGLEHLLRAFTVIRCELPDTRLLIVGEGNLRESLIQLAKNLDLEQCVTFIGYRENPYKYVARSDVYVLTSENEGFPNSLVEAMFFVPVVSVNCETGPLEILSDGEDLITEKEFTVCRYGILTPPVQKTRNYISKSIEPEEQAIANAVVNLLKCKELYNTLKEVAAKRAHQFDEDMYLNKLIDIIERS